MNDTTLNYYDANAENFIKGTISVDFSATQDKFLSLLSGKKILDFGCGSGRDTKYFLEKGYEVTAIDGSLELCKAASLYTGIEVKHMLFQELNENKSYDGIWACSSILHLPKSELKEVLLKMSEALVQDGIIYTSFKYGIFEGERNGRYFTNFTLETFESFIKDIRELAIKEHWITGDVRPGREDEKWLNLILQKTSF
ncbi:class I SAM-dependent methyltransferase [Oribacterium sp. P6A1]|uniref:class I SAM-dependent methyltransferase n=1 Tax=Oribacterium sp. P6A1 TaxID=1410612 RepID=UPI00056CFA8B|nr:class I SAM-dependent methyltransferase [Oribacterium sp. P6A1]